MGYCFMKKKKDRALFVVKSGNLIQVKYEDGAFSLDPMGYAAWIFRYVPHTELDDWSLKDDK